MLSFTSSLLIVRTSAAVHFSPTVFPFLEGFCAPIFLTAKLVFLCEVSREISKIKSIIRVLQWFFQLYASAKTFLKSISEFSTPKKMDPESNHFDRMDFLKKKSWNTCVLNAG